MPAATAVAHDFGIIELELDAMARVTKCGDGIGILRPMPGAAGAEMEIKRGS